MEKILTILNYFVLAVSVFLVVVSDLAYHTSGSSDKIHNTSTRLVDMRTPRQYSQYCSVEKGHHSAKKESKKENATTFTIAVLFHAAYETHVRTQTHAFYTNSHMCALAENKKIEKKEANVYFCLLSPDFLIRKSA